MPRKRQSQADRYRHHRAAFELAQELGCTPAEAAEELARRAQRAEQDRAREARRLLAGARAGHWPGRTPAPPSEPAQPWWLRD